VSLRIRTYINLYYSPPTLSIVAETKLKEEITISQRGVTVSKRFTPSAYDVPAIELSVESSRVSATDVTIQERVPSFYPVEDVAFHPEYEAENWRRSDSRTLSFERRVKPKEQFKTIYGLRVHDKKEAVKFQTRPELTVSVPSSARGPKSNAPEKALNRIVSDMDGYEFEHFVADVWAKRGWNTSVTDGSNDNGVDIVATRDGLFAEKHLIQAKKFADTSVSSPDIQKYASLHLNSDVDAVVVVTTSDFSGPAEEIAEKRNVKLVDGAEIQRLVREMNLDGLIDEYTR